MSRQNGGISARSHRDGAARTRMARKFGRTFPDNRARFMAGRQTSLRSCRDLFYHSCMLLTLRKGRSEIAVNISGYWADQHGIGIKGWVSADEGPPDDLEFLCDGAAVPINWWHSRDDVA